jgi:hypothetical protein
MGNIFSPKMAEASSGAHPASLTVGFGVWILSQVIKRGFMLTTNPAPSAEFQNEWSCTSAVCIYLCGEYRNIFFESLP